MSKKKYVDKIYKGLVSNNKDKLSIERCSDFHIKVEGKFLVNVFPSTGSAYIQGMNHKIPCHDINHIFDLANGKSEVEAITKSKRRNKKSALNRMWNKGDRFCFVCGEEIKDIKQASVEHKIPLSKGGSNRADNLALSHAGCNHKRGNKI